MMEFYSISMICGFAVGMQHELIEENNYLIISLGIVEVVFIW
jgi:hypothetical protein